MEKINIAIDGPASSGKSTVAKILARDLGFIYTDTGAMYRSVTYLAIKHQISFDDEKGLVALIDRYPISFRSDASGQLVFADGEDITDKIRSVAVTHNVSEVSAFAKVRKRLVVKQQEIAEAGGVVMDGRDIGTVVLPDAQVKIFLVASVEERARRRYKENTEKGLRMDFEVLKREIEQRDYLDSHREESPLKQAEDAICVDTTGLTIEQVVSRIKEITTEKIEKQIK